MIEITIPEQLYWNDEAEEFFTIKEQNLVLEHSLLSLSRWESKWNKPFLKKEDRTLEESIDYIRCMTINRITDDNCYYGINKTDMDKIFRYIESPQTATTIRRTITGKNNSEQVTSEIIYYWMIELGIPFSCEKWHLNRLITLIDVCNIKKGPQKKMSQKEIMQQNAKLNAMRKSQLHSKG